VAISGIKILKGGEVFRLDVERGFGPFLHLQLYRDFTGRVLYSPQFQKPGEPLSTRAVGIDKAGTRGSQERREMKGITRDFSVAGECAGARPHYREPRDAPQLQEFFKNWDYRKLKRIDKRHLQKFRKERDEWEN
jgi:hypothetical protein